MTRGFQAAWQTKSPPRQALEPSYQVHGQILTKSLKMLLRLSNIIAYMSKTSRNIILPESKKQRKTTWGGRGHYASQIYPPRLGAGKLKSPPRQVKGGLLLWNAEQLLPKGYDYRLVESLTGKTYYKKVKKTYYMLPGFASQHVVSFQDLNIDIFLEVQDKKYNWILYLIGYIAYRLHFWYKI